MSVTVRELLETAGPMLGLRLVAGARGLARTISKPRLQQPGLALAGFLPQLHPDRVQVLGRSEVAFLAQLPRARARAAVSTVARAGVACFVVTNGTRSPAIVRATAEAVRVPLLASTLRTSEFIRHASTWLEERMAPETQVHGNLVEVQGIGILIRGASGIGKSEAALDLVVRGHRLVADDVVLVRRISPTVLRGRAATLLRHHMEIRGLGVMDIEALFGTLATLDERQIDLVVDLVEWTETVDRLGLDETQILLLDTPLPMIRLPVSPGRSVALLIETAARNHLLRARGRHSARDFAARIERATTAGRKTRSRASRSR